MISALLAEALQSRRSDFNHRFRLAAQLQPHLDPEATLRFVAECVDPIVQAVYAVNPDAVNDVVETAYDCALQVVGQRLAERQGRYTTIAKLWRDLLPRAASALVTDARRLIPSLTNAVHQLSSSNPAAAERWLTLMNSAAPSMTCANDWLQLGQVLAWRAGLAHYRDGALAALESLGEPLVCAALGITPSERLTTLQRLRADRWFNPNDPHTSSLRIVHTTGAFRGFGGTFLQPPLVKATHSGWLIRSASDYWFLIADAFGATLHRASADEWNEAPNQAHHVGTRIAHEGLQLDLPGAGPITSSALSENAIACTFAHSHHIALIAVHS